MLTQWISDCSEAEKNEKSRGCEILYSLSLACSWGCKYLGLLTNATTEFILGILIDWESRVFKNIFEITSFKRCFPWVFTKNYTWQKTNKN